MQELPHQDNHCDCGLFVLAYLHFFTAYPPSNVDGDKKDPKAAISEFACCMHLAGRAMDRLLTSTGYMLGRRQRPGPSKKPPIGPTPASPCAWTLSGLYLVPCSCDGLLLLSRHQGHDSLAIAWTMSCLSPAASRLGAT